MQETLIANFDNHDLFLLSGVDYSFYINLPKNILNTKLCIELKPEYTAYMTDDVNKIIDRVKNYYSKLDQFDITLVMPIFNDNILEDVRTNSSELIYNKLDNLLGNIINESYSFFLNNNISLDNTINFINNENCKVFMNWFITRYKGRVEYHSILELMSVAIAKVGHYNKVETPGINFVVGSPTTEIKLEKIEEEKENVKREETKKELEELIVSQKPVLQNATSGYASYLLLGFLSVGLSLLFLYMLLK